MISRRHLRLLIALLLPLMVVRGMLPAGYMASAEGGKLRIVMCSAGVLAAGDDSRKDSGDRSVSDSGQCVFAQAASLAPPAQVVVSIVAPVDPVLVLRADSAPLPPATGPPRLAAARAPPAFLA